MARIHLHIDELVLRGVAPADRDALVRNFQLELQRQLQSADATTFGESRQQPRLQIGPGAPSPNAHDMGSQAAAQLLQGLRG